MDAGALPPVCVKLEDVSNLNIVKFEVQVKNHAQKEIKCVDLYINMPFLIWTLCTQATQDKLKTAPGFAKTEAMKEFVNLNVAIKEITPQFKSIKDLSIALTVTNSDLGT